MKKHIPYIIIGILLIVAVFYGGMKFGQIQNPSTKGMPQAGMPSGNRQFSNNKMNRPNANGGLLNGEIISKDEKSITIKLDDGGSKIIFLSEKTSIGKTETATLTDVEVGKQITAMGATNSDGSITAQSIQIRPKTTDDIQK
ncbi:hypothetical protein M0P48_03155 [Candidatus Gracilibacteria bacterium]|jgi:hypothetical protein|nr:hypothetical protein [Candidatus Gracilibacteria bacterium]